MQGPSKTPGCVKYDEREDTVVDTRLQRRRHVGIEEGWEVASRLSALLWRRAWVDRRPGNSLCWRLRLKCKAIAGHNVLIYGKALDVKAVRLHWGQQQESLAPADRCVQVLIVVLVEAGDATTVSWTVNASQLCTCQQEGFQSEGNLPHDLFCLETAPQKAVLSAHGEQQQPCSPVHVRIWMQDQQKTLYIFYHVANKIMFK